MHRTPPAVLSRLSSDVEAVLSKHGEHREAFRIHYCFGYKQCHSPYCVKCISRCGYAQRKYLLQVIPQLLKNNPTYQVWLITGAAADSPDVRTNALAAVSGMRKLLKHRRLKHRIVGYFAALEVTQQRGREHPCAHVHALIVAMPMDKGRYRISKKNWVRMWEEVCPQHRKRLPVRRRRSKGIIAKSHTSLDARMVKRTPQDILRVIRYCTKWARFQQVSRDISRLLIPEPRVFLNRIKALRRVPRFFGPLHKGKRVRSAEREKFTGEETCAQQDQQTGDLLSVATREARDLGDHLANNVMNPFERVSRTPQPSSIPSIETPLNAQQLAQVVPLHPVTILRWARENRIPHRRLSARKIVFLPSEINQWLSSGREFYTDSVGHAASTHEREAA